MKSSAGFIFTIMLLLLCGCSPRTSISTIRISDPDAGGTIDVPVDRNGAFSKETKAGNFVSIASGTISDNASGVSAVKLVYERRLHSEQGKTKTEKIETTFTAQPDAEVPFGKNPSRPDVEQVDAESAFSSVTAKLLRGK